MNPFNLSESIIRDAIGKKNYELTGLLKTGEITIAIVSDHEKEMVEFIMNSPNKNKKEMIEHLKKSTDNSTDEILEVFKQLSVSGKDKNNICWKNGLRIKT